VEAQSEHSFGVGGGDLQCIDDQAAVLAKQGAGPLDLGGGDPPGGMAEAVLQSGQDLAFWAIWRRRRPWAIFRPRTVGRRALVVVVQGPGRVVPAEPGSVAEGAGLLLQGFALGVGNQAVLGFRVGPVLHDLVDA